MRSILPNPRLQRISEALVVNLESWKEGASIVADSGKSIDDLMIVVASDRWHLSDSFRKQGNRLMKMEHPAYRSAISRFYYSMYHAARACVYMDKRGDDYEAHIKLPLHLPRTLSAAVNWQTKLKDARLLRNRADYESYPKTDKAWKRDALLIQSDALALLGDTKIFLNSKGCSL